MATRYRSNQAGKVRFQHDLLRVMNELMREGSTVGRWAGRAPRINDRLRGNLQLSDDKITYLGRSTRLRLLRIGEEPQIISDIEYRRAATVSDLIGILWVSLNGGSRTWP